MRRETTSSPGSLPHDTHCFVTRESLAETRYTYTSFFRLWLTVLILLVNYSVLHTLSTNIMIRDVICKILHYSQNAWNGCLWEYQQCAKRQTGQKRSMLAHCCQRVDVTVGIQVTSKRKIVFTNVRKTRIATTVFHFKIMHGNIATIANETTIA